MATAPRLGVFSAREVMRWATALLTASAVLGVGIAVFTYRHRYRTSLQDELHRLVTVERYAVAHGNFRSLYESVSPALGETYLQLLSSVSNFEWGRRHPLSVCASHGLEGSHLTLCGDPQLPYGWGTALLLLLGGASVGFWRLLNRKEHRTEQSLAKDFQSLGLPAPVGVSYGDFMARVAESRDQADRARRLAHDLRSPLSALQVLTDAPHHLEKEQGRALLKRATQRLLGMADELVSPGPRSGTPVELGTLLKPFVREKRLEKRHMGYIQLRLQLPGHPVHVRTVPTALERILSNLVNNAFESIESDRGQVTVTLLTNRDAVSIEVSDTGPGMDDHALHAFQEGRAPTSDKVGGSGIGLQNSLELARSLGIAFTLHPSSTGTTARLRFP